LKSCGTGSAPGPVQVDATTGAIAQGASKPKSWVLKYTPAPSGVGSPTLDFASNTIGYVNNNSGDGHVFAVRLLLVTQDPAGNWLPFEQFLMVFVVDIGDTSSSASVV